VKVLENVGLNFVRGKSLYSNELGFAAPGCRLVRACNLITVTGAQKCLFYLAGFRSDCARVIEEYNASVRPFQQWRHWPEAGFNRQHLFSSITSGFFLIPSRLSLITYRTNPYRATCRRGKAISHANWNKPMPIPLSSL